MLSFLIGAFEGCASLFLIYDEVVKIHVFSTVELVAKVYIQACRFFHHVQYSSNLGIVRIVRQLELVCGRNSRVILCT